MEARPEKVEQHLNQQTELERKPKQITHIGVNNKGSVHKEPQFDIGEIVQPFLDESSSLSLFSGTVTTTLKATLRNLLGLYDVASLDDVVIFGQDLANFVLESPSAIKLMRFFQLSTSMNIHEHQVSLLPADCSAAALSFRRSILKDFQQNGYGEYFRAVNSYNGETFDTSIDQENSLEFKLHRCESAERIPALLTTYSETPPRNTKTTFQSYLEYPFFSVNDPEDQTTSMKESSVRESTTGTVYPKHTHTLTINAMGTSLNTFIPVSIPPANSSQPHASSSVMSSKSNVSNESQSQNEAYNSDDVVPPHSPSIASLESGDKVVLFFHGGAFLCGSPFWTLYRDLSARLATNLSTPEHKVKVLSVHYRLAPNNIFPAPILDGAAAYEALLAAGVHPADVIFAGDSAGGNIALSLAASIADDRVPLPSPGGLVLYSPWADLALRSTVDEFRLDNDMVLPLGAIEAAGKAVFGCITDTMLSDGKFNTIATTIKKSIDFLEKTLSYIPFLNVNSNIAASRVGLEAKLSDPTQTGSADADSSHLAMKMQSVLNLEGYSEKLKSQWKHDIAEKLQATPSAVYPSTSYQSTVHYALRHKQGLDVVKEKEKSKHLQNDLENVSLPQSNIEASNFRFPVNPYRDDPELEEKFLSYALLHPTASPIFFPVETLQSLPPTMIINGGAEQLRFPSNSLFQTLCGDTPPVVEPVSFSSSTGSCHALQLSSNARFEDKQQQQQDRFFVYPKMFHDFVLLNALPESMSVDVAVGDFVKESCWKSSPQTEDK